MIDRPLIKDLKDMAIRLIYERQREKPIEPYLKNPFKELLMGDSYNWVKEDFSNVMIYLEDKRFINLDYNHIKNDMKRSKFGPIITIKAKLIDYYEKNLLKK